MVLAGERFLMSEVPLYMWSCLRSGVRRSAYGVGFRVASRGLVGEQDTKHSSGLRVSGVGLRVQGLRLEFIFYLLFSVSFFFYLLSNLLFIDDCLGLEVYGLRSRVQGSGLSIAR